MSHHFVFFFTGLEEPVPASNAAVGAQAGETSSESAPSKNAVPALAAAAALGAAAVAVPTAIVATKDAPAVVAPSGLFLLLDKVLQQVMKAEKVILSLDWILSLAWKILSRGIL